MGASSALAAGTPAGTVISNQAVVRYQDGSGAEQAPVSSNIVTTTVGQAYGVDVFTANTPQNTLPGATVYFPVRVTNTGNGPDQYTLVVSGTQGDWTRQLFLDANANGVLDAGESQASGTGVLGADQSKSFLVAVAVPGSATAGTTDTTTTEATGVAPSGARGSAVDVTRVTLGAVLTGTKTSSPAAVDPLAESSADRTVTYTIQFANTGAAAAQNLVIEDPIPATVAGLVLAGPAASSLGGTLDYYNSGTAAFEAFNAAKIGLYTRVRLMLDSLAAGASGQFSFQVVVPQGSAPGSLSNTATIKADDTETVPTTTTTTTLSQSAGVALSAAPERSIAPGGSADAAHTATNMGNGADTLNLAAPAVPDGWTVYFLRADGVTTIADTNGDGVPDTGSLAPGGSFAFLVKITAPAAAGPGAYAVGLRAASTRDAAQIAAQTDALNVTLGPTLTATKTASDTAPRADSVVTYTIAYQVANAAAHAVVITDAIPANTALVPGTITSVVAGLQTEPNATVADGVITWNLGILPAGTTGTVSFQVRVSRDLPAGTRIANTATITYQDESGATRTTVASTAPDLVVAASAPVLGIGLAVDRQEAAPGDELTYTLTATNTGLEPVSALVLTDTLPERVTPVLGSLGAGATYDPATRRITWEFGTLARLQGTATITFRARIALAMPEGTTELVNHASLSGDGIAEPLAAAPVTTRVTAAPQLTVTKTAERQQVATGESVRFTITVRNTGSAPAHDLTVTDTLPRGMALPDGSRARAWQIAQLDPGQEEQRFVDVVIVGDNQAPGLHVLTNSVSASATNARDVQATADVQVLVPYLQITKRALRGEAQVGDVVPFEITVENLSQSDAATDIEIRDILPESLLYRPGTARLNGAPAPDLLVGSTRYWRLDRLDPKSTARLTLHCIVAARGATEIVNTAEAVWRTPDGTRLTAGPARATVHTTDGFFSNRGLVIGRLFVDSNGNRMADEGEPGLANVAVFTDNGVMAITDEFGKYALPDVAPGDHVVRVDTGTLPSGYTLVSLDNFDSGNPRSRFCRVLLGGLVKVNFAVRGSGSLVGSARPGTPRLQPAQGLTPARGVER